MEEKNNSKNVESVRSSDVQKGGDIRSVRWLKWSVVIVTVLTVGALVTPETARANVTACVQKSTGSLRLVDSANQCKIGETPLSLSTPVGSSQRGSVGEGGNTTGLISCGPSEIVPLTLPIVLTEPSTILAFGNAGLQRQGPNTAQFEFEVFAELLSGGFAVAWRLSPYGFIDPGSIANASGVSGPLLSSQTGDIYTAAPGSYTLRLRVRLFGASECNVPFRTIGDSQLSFVTQPAN